uniref:DUF1758 domain-containing protein n=1 Tax=Toxocara canis TaxID=6265 RepID=A0A183VAG9_TOXCA
LHGETGNAGCEEVIAVRISSDEDDNASTCYGDLFDSSEGEIDDFEEADGKIGLNMRFPKRMSCMAHTPQLGLAGGLKASGCRAEVDALQKLTICGFGSTNSATYDSMQVALNVHLTSGVVKKVQSKSIEQITQEIQTVDLGPEDLESLKYEEVANLKMPMKWKAPSIVTGIDCYHQFITGTRKRLNSGFELIDSEVGPMICGKGHIKGSSGNERELSANTALAETPTSEDIDHFWKLEQIGIEPMNMEIMDSLAVQYTDSDSHTESAASPATPPPPTRTIRSPHDRSSSVHRSITRSDGWRARSTKRRTNLGEKKVWIEVRGTSGRDRDQAGYF